MSLRNLLLPLIFSMACVVAEETKEEEDPGMVVFRDHCMACHLQTGMGIREMNAPSIAGLPRWYVADQLRKFRRDERGFSDEDDSGNLMQANAAALDERSIAFVGRHIEKLPTNQHRNTLEAEIPKEGHHLYQTQCADCHGEKAEGKRTDRVPPLNRQPDWYLLKQMNNFLAQKRIHSADDPLPEFNEKDLEAIIAWIAQLPVETDD